MSSNKGMDKEDVVHLCKRTFYPKEKVYILNMGEGELEVWQKKEICFTCLVKRQSMTKMMDRELALEEYYFSEKS